MENLALEDKNIACEHIDTHLHNNKTSIIKEPNRQRHPITTINNKQPPPPSNDGNFTENNFQKNVAVLLPQRSLQYPHSAHPFVADSQSTKTEGKSSSQELIRRRNLNFQNDTSGKHDNDSFHQNRNHQQSSLISDDGIKRNDSKQSDYLPSPSHIQWIVIICLLVGLLVPVLIVVYDYITLQNKISSKDALIDKLVHDIELKHAKLEAKVDSYMWPQHLVRGIVRHR